MRRCQKEKQHMRAHKAVWSVAVCGRWMSTYKLRHSHRLRAVGVPAQDRVRLVEAVVQLYGDASLAVYDDLWRIG